MSRRPARSPLFPYTTLFRSTERLEGLSKRRPPLEQIRPLGGDGGHPTALLCPAPMRANFTRKPPTRTRAARSEEHTSELQSRLHLVCRLLLEKNKPRNPREI